MKHETRAGRFMRRSNWMSTGRAHLIVTDLAAPPERGSIWRLANHRCWIVETIAPGVAGAGDGRISGLFVRWRNCCRICRKAGAARRGVAALCASGRKRSFGMSYNLAAAAGLGRTEVFTCTMPGRASGGCIARIAER